MSLELNLDNGYMSRTTEARTGRETLGQLVSLHTVLNDKGVEILRG